MVQCYAYLEAKEADKIVKQHFQDRIFSVCQGRLSWLFYTTATYRLQSPFFAVSDGDSAKRLKALYDTPNLAYSTTGSYTFLQLCLFLKMWPSEWLFVLHFLDAKLDNWLSCLRKSQYMSNLWIEAQTSETFKAYNSLVEDIDYIERDYPQYDLSDSALLYLTVVHIEKAIETIEKQCKAQRHTADESYEIKVKRVREYFDAHQRTLSVQRIRSNILATFKIPMAELDTQSPPHVKTGLEPSLAAASDRAQPLGPNPPSRSQPIGL